MDRIAALTAVLESNPSDSFARYGLAMALAAEGRSEEALGEYGIILERNPEYVPAYQMSAQLLLKLDRRDDARERLTSGLHAARQAGNSHAVSEMQAMLDEITV